MLRWCAAKKTEGCCVCVSYQRREGMFALDQGITSQSWHQVSGKRMSLDIRYHVWGCHQTSGIMYEDVTRHQVSGMRMSPDIRHQVWVCYLGWEKDAADDLEDVVGPGVAGVRPHHGDQVTDAEDGHHDDQSLVREEFYLYVWIWWQEADFNLSLIKEKSLCWW